MGAQEHAYWLCKIADFVSRMCVATSKSDRRSKRLATFKKKTQSQYIEQAERYFTNVPIWKAYLFNDQVLGLDGLKKLGNQLYSEVDPIAFYQNEKAYEYLSESIDLFPNQEKLKFLLELNGFTNVSYLDLFDGIVSVHKGYKI